MAYGIIIRSANNKILLDSTKTTWQYIDSFSVSAGTTVYKNYLLATGLELKYAVFLVNDAPDNQGAYAPSVVISGTYVTVSGGNQNSIIMVLGR